MSSPVRPADLDAAVPSVFSSICASFKSLFLLGPLLKTWWHYVYDSNGDPTPAFLASISSIGVPTGGVLAWPVSGSIPTQFLVCNGQTVSRAIYPGLYAVLRDTYGNGDGSTTFQLPDFTDNYLVGASATVGVGSSVGNATVSLIEANNGPHTHRSIAAAQGENAFNVLWGSSPDNSKTGKVYPSDHGLVNIASEEIPIASTLKDSGTGQAFSILPPSKAIIWIIKT